MNTNSTAVVNFSVEVITLPVSDVERALRFYVDQVGFALDVDYAPNDAFRVVQLTPPGSGCSVQIGKGLIFSQLPPRSGVADDEVSFQLRYREPRTHSYACAMSVHF